MSDFLDWLGDNAWSVWLGLALIFGIIETVSIDLVFLMLAGGALAGVVTSLFGVPFSVQAIVAIATSAALLLVVRPVARKHLQVPHSIRTGAAALVGIARRRGAEGRTRHRAGQARRRDLDCARL